MEFLIGDRQAVTAVSRLRRLTSVALCRVLVVICAAAAVDGWMQPEAVPDLALSKGLRYRLVGPFRGGRVNAVAGVPGDPRTYYFGAAAGGVWKTETGGAVWTPIFDGQPVAAIGAIAVAPSDPEVLYIGSGDSRLRHNASHGDGVYGSTDGGRTWRHLGLRDSRHISRIVVHPRDARLLYVAALGHASGPNEERGVFRSDDGGASWRKVLYVDAGTGAADLAIDPHNPEVLFAAMWQFRREPWNFTSGGPGSGLFRSADGGRTWTRLRGAGLPDGILGKIGITVSPVDSARVYAIIEARDRGLYRSDDGGGAWQLVSAMPELLQRPWFFMSLVADPRDRDTLYVLNINVLRSTDGGRTFTVVDTPHVDNHALWISPDDPRRMISGNDGGANVSLDGGRTWTRSDNNQPTGQFYHVATDDRFPYYLYGGQQDYDTMAIASRGPHNAITEADWYPMVPCEMGFAVPDPRDPLVVYGGCTDGGISRYDHRTRRNQSVEPWPETALGHGAADARYRFQWTAPIMISRHDPRKLYHAANVLFLSEDEGMTWRAISPDLTRNDRSRQQPSGGPLTKDNVGGEFYGTIFALAESPRPGLLWAGSDDGLVHMSEDGGTTWRNVTPGSLPEWSRISLIDPSPHDPGGAVMAADRHLLDDYRPYIYRTRDFGRSWQLVASGIPDGAFVRAVREDPVQPDLLYAGTETGVYVSLDGGARWRSLQLNLPRAPVHDLVVKGHDIVVATHGRAFWILDDVSALRAMARGVPLGAAHLFAPSPVYRVRDDFGTVKTPAGENPPPGAIIYYYLPAAPRSALTFTIVDSRGQMVRTFSSGPSASERPPFDRSSPLTERPGLNRFVWDLRYTGHRPIEDHFLFWHPPHAPPVGPLAVPGHYNIRLEVDGRTLRADLEIRADPRVRATPADLEAQFALHAQLRDALTTITDAVLRIRSIRAKLRESSDGRQPPPALDQAVRTVAAKLTAIDEALTEPRMKVSADAFNYPLRLDNKIATLLGIVANSDTRPSRASQDLYGELRQTLEDRLKTLDAIVARDLGDLNRRRRRFGLAPIDGGSRLQRPSSSR